MVGIYGINDIPELANANQVDARGKKAATAPIPAPTQDGVQISPEAAQAARLAQLIQESKVQAEMRQERVAQAREAVQNGAYKLQETVLKVAARIGKYLAMEKTS